MHCALPVVLEEKDEAPASRGTMYRAHGRNDGHFGTQLGYTMNRAHTTPTVNRKIDSQRFNIATICKIKYEIMIQSIDFV